MTRLLRRIAGWLHAHPAPSLPPPRDKIADNLREAVVAETRAKAANIESYKARVEAMIEDFFVKFGSRDVRRHP